MERLKAMAVRIFGTRGGKLIEGTIRIGIYSAEVEIVSGERSAMSFKIFPNVFNLD